VPVQLRETKFKALIDYRFISESYLFQGHISSKISEMPQEQEPNVAAPVTGLPDLDGFKMTLRPAEFQWSLTGGDWHLCSGFSTIKDDDSPYTLYVAKSAGAVIKCLPHRKDAIFRAITGQLLGYTKTIVRSTDPRYLVQPNTRCVISDSELFAVLNEAVSTMRVCTYGQKRL